MSGFVRNDWNRFLNGGTSHYNFLYRSEVLPIPTPVSVPVPVPGPVAKKSNKVVIPTQKGGKQKSRHQRSHRQKKYKLARLTHRK